MSSIALMAPALYTSPSTLDSFVVVSAVPAVLLSFVAENTAATARWIQVHNTAAQPAGGAVPLISLKLATVAQESFTIPAPDGLRLSTGLTIALSTTGPTYTAPSVPEGFLSVFYTK